MAHVQRYDGSAIPAERLDWKAPPINVKGLTSSLWTVTSISVAPAPEMSPAESALVQSMLASRACSVHNGSETVIIFIVELFTKVSAGLIGGSRVPTGHACV